MGDVVADALKYLRDNPGELVRMESIAFGACAGRCEPRELAQDEWPAHYLDDAYWTDTDRPRAVIGCSKCRHVLRVARGPA